MNEDLINRITYHLSSGGLFNPELADHLAVRNLLMECRDALAQRTWVGLTKEERHEISMANRPYCADIMAAHEEELKRRNT